LFRNFFLISKIFFKNFQSMDNVRQTRPQRSTSQELRNRYSSRTNSRLTSRESSRERGQSRDRGREFSPEIHQINIEDKPPKSPHSKQRSGTRGRKPKTYDDQSSDESNWDMALNKQKSNTDTDNGE
jgi:hypothetical protein